VAPVIWNQGPKPFMVLQMVSLVRTQFLGMSQMAAVGHIERDCSPNIVIK
jgi:hypothetical protein